MTKRVDVKLPAARGRFYRVTIRSGLLANIPHSVLLRMKKRRVFVITDSNVRRLYGTAFIRTLAESLPDPRLLDFPAGEASKSIALVSALHTALLEEGIDRTSLIVALGGGVVGDIAGFAAATILRGVDFVQIPTTLLSQVDSSVGGKVGIDHRLGKNLIGAFYQPTAVFIDPSVLRTLPAAEYRNGLAESAKIAAALDRSLFRWIERNFERITARDPRTLTRLIAECVALKASVVRADEYESGLRKTLNLGHTVGHAIEAATGYATPHGAAVAIGLAAESLLACRMGILALRERNRLLAALQALGLPVRFPLIRRRARFLSALASDKKARGGTPLFALLTRIGTTAVDVEVPARLIQDLLRARP
jgi:3-dehydroquinate synthase